MTLTHYDLVGTPSIDARQLPAAYQKEKQAGYEVPIAITSIQRISFSFQAQYRTNSDQPNFTPLALTIDSANILRTESSGGISSSQEDGPFQSRLAVETTESALNPHKIYFSFLPSSSFSSFFSSRQKNHSSSYIH